MNLARILGMCIFTMFIDQQAHKSALLYTIQKLSDKWNPRNAKIENARNLFDQNRCFDTRHDIYTDVHHTII